MKSYCGSVYVSQSIANYSELTALKDQPEKNNMLNFDLLERNGGFATLTLMFFRALS